MLACTRHLEHPALRGPSRAAIDFLLGEMKGPGLWTYWSQYHPRHDEAPPDLDDIACVSWALRSRGLQVQSCEELVLENRNAAGLFYTWMFPRAGSSEALRNTIREHWRPSLPQVFEAAKLREVTDLAVNANVLLFVGQEDPRADASIAAIVDAVEGGDELEGCDYYNDRAMIWYFISRAYASGITRLHPTRAPILHNIRALHGASPSAQQIALFCSTLINFDSAEIPSAWLDELRGRQAADGSWPAEVAYILGDRASGTGLYYGSPELTTALCVEALSRWLLTTAPHAHL